MVIQKYKCRGSAGRRCGQEVMSGAKIIAIRSHLKLLLHSKNCSEGICLNTNCAVIKEVLLHLKVCRSVGKCPVRYCHSSRLILKHWNSCNGCGVCFNFRSGIPLTRGQSSRHFRVGLKEKKCFSYSKTELFRRRYHSNRPSLRFGRLDKNLSQTFDSLSFGSDTDLEFDSE